MRLQLTPFPLWNKNICPIFVVALRTIYNKDMETRGERRWTKGCLLVVLALLCACSPKGEAQAQEEGGQTAELPLPNVPKELTSPTDRAEYIMLHFWDGMDFADTLRSHNKMFVELNFVNFLSLFPHATDDAVSRSLENLLHLASADHDALTLLCETAEKYLSEADSPMRNEEYYIAFLEEQLRLPNQSASDRLRPTMRLLTAKKNRQGTRATDFTYTTREGKRCTLHGTEAPMMLLAFYDPACSHCTDILHGLEVSEAITSRVADGSLSVLAIYTEGNRQLWDETKAGMPKEWTVGIDESNIVDSVLYDIPAMPVLYLLSRDKTVLLKDPTPEAMEDYLRQ